MSFVDMEAVGPIARLTLGRGKVNALNPAVVAELRERLRFASSESSVRAVVLTGSGKFFSFGFDIPEFLSYSREEFTRYLRDFTDLCTELFVFPKPLVGAINGHAIAGGCMLALGCDVRVMTQGPARISLNEIGFGSSVFAGSVAMLKFAVGAARASEMLYSGAMYSAAEASALGLIHEVVDEAGLSTRAEEIARTLAGKDSRAFASIKRLLRRPVAEEITRREMASIVEFVDIWYSEPTWSNLRGITIRS